MEKFIKGFFYTIFAIIGIYAGLKLDSATLPFFTNLSPELLMVNKIMFAALGMLIGVGVAIPLQSGISQSIKFSVKKIYSIPMRQLIGGGVGITLGLLLSSLIAYILSFIPVRSIQYGKLLFSLLLMILTIFICYIGIFFGVRTIGRIPLSKLTNFKGEGLEYIWGSNYKVLDTSVIIDGRIYEIAKTGFLEGTIAVPRFVLTELQNIADSSDSLKRNRGRRGLDILDNLKQELGIQILEKDYPAPDVDGKLIDLAKEMQATMVTTDYNLNKTASLQGVAILNINDLANAVKPPILPGEEFKIRVIKEGKEPSQGIGYLDSGTMIVIENGKKYIGEEVVVEATSCLQTSAGRMIFVKVK